jgi:outer membrane biosynthesis protein TonB
MRRLLAWIGGVLGGIAAWRFFRRRSQSAPGVATVPPAAEVDPRAEALRAKLEEVREAEPEPEPPPELEPPAEPEPEPEPEPPAEPEAEAAPEPETESADPDERRRSVHEHGRAAVEEMRGGGGDEASS